MSYNLFSTHAPGLCSVFQINYLGAGYYLIFQLVKGRAGTLPKSIKFQCLGQRRLEGARPRSVLFGPWLPTGRGKSSTGDSPAMVPPWRGGSGEQQRAQKALGCR